MKIGIWVDVNCYTYKIKLFVSYMRTDVFGYRFLLNIIVGCSTISPLTKDFFRHRNGSITIPFFDNNNSSLECIMMMSVVGVVGGNGRASALD